MMDVGLVNDGPVSEDLPQTPRIGVDFSALDEEVQKPRVVCVMPLHVLD
jgi:D-tyrosyl-tRNA(Tyr) deacylase